MKLLVLFFLVKVSADLNMEEYIRQGNNADDGDFPYHIGLSITTQKKKKIACSGSLISPTFIITAAHCIDRHPVENIVAFLGSKYRKQGTKRTARFKFLHPNWDRSRNDIGLLQINSISYSDRIYTIDLPSLSDSHSNYEGRIAVATGWGRVNTESGLASILQYAKLLVISNAACAMAHDVYNMPKTIICAADPDGSATCKGDSGGPLVELDSGTLIGITSFGPGANCAIHFGSAFTRITSYRKWIYDVTGI